MTRMGLGLDRQREMVFDGQSDEDEALAASWGTKRETAIQAGVENHPHLDQLMTHYA